MKKILGIALSLIMVVMLLTACGKKEDVDEENHKTKTAKSDTITSENKTSNSSSDEIHTTTSTINGVKVNWEYTINKEDEIENLKCSNPKIYLKGNITVPSTLDGKTVVSIGARGFASAEDLTGVIIPDSIKEIGFDAFAGCTSLKNVDLGKVEILNSEIFKGCSNLTEVTIPNTISSHAGRYSMNLLGSNSITKVILEDGIGLIPEDLCSGTSIQEITIPNSVKIIECDAFSNSALEEMNIPSSVKEIGERAFKDCTKLRKVNLGEVKKIGALAFKGCTNLEEVVLSNEIEELDAWTFEGCSSLQNIVVPESVGIVDLGAFDSCINFKKIVVLGNNTEIVSTTTYNDISNLITIYCYEGSKAAKFADSYNIKYEYLKK